MNRRNFLKSIGKICAVLPFVGSSSAVAKTGASETKSGCSWKGKLKCGGQNGTLCLRCSYGVKRSGTRPATKEDFQNALTEVVKERLNNADTELGESRSFIYQGYYFTVQDIYDSELKYIALHPFFKIQGILSMFILNDQFDDLQRRDMFLDEMIRQWKEKQVYTTEELREF